MTKLRKNIVNFLNYLFLMYLLIFSFFLGLSFYDSTTGLDYAKYSNAIDYYQGKSVELLDQQGTIYFYTLSKLYSLNLHKSNLYDYDLISNNNIQLFNFFLFFVGLIGIYKLLKKYSFSNQEIFLSFAITSFLPASYYMRLTMKPEIMAFTFLPWFMIYFDKFIKTKIYKYCLISSFLLSLMVTLKPSIGGMILLSFLYVYKNEVKNLIIDLKFIITNIANMFIFLFLNFKVTNISFFSKPISVDTQVLNRWDNTANLSFFYKIDLPKLITDPYKFIHSDSFISITLLDTFSDYFGFYWNHQEKSNYLAFSRIEFTENFLIQTYLQQYLSIVLALSIYLLIFVLYFKKIPNYKILTFPIFGILILIINSQGFPVKNFDPTTGDLFKVHYYSFLFTFTFIYLITFLNKKMKNWKFLNLVLIPVFLITMGFPKELSTDTQKALIEKINISEICFTINFLPNVSC